MKSTKVFFRSFYVSLVVVMCIIFGFYSATEVYENTVRIQSGEYKKAVEISDGYIRIFDYEIEF